MKVFAYMFTGLLGLIGIVLFMSVIIMWFCVPILLYNVFQKVKSIDDKLKK